MTCPCPANNTRAKFALLAPFSSYRGPQGSRAQLSWKQPDRWPSEEITPKPYLSSSPASRMASRLGYRTTQPPVGPIASATHRAAAPLVLRNHAAIGARPACQNHQGILMADLSSLNHRQSAKLSRVS